MTMDDNERGKSGDDMNEVRWKPADRQSIRSCDDLAKKNGMYGAYAGIGIMVGVQEFVVKHKFKNMLVRVIFPILTGSSMGLIIWYNRLKNCRQERAHKAELYKSARKSLEEDS